MSRMHPPHATAPGDAPKCRPIRWPRPPHPVPNRLLLPVSLAVHRGNQASSSVRGLEGLLDSLPQELIGTPMACCTVKPTRALGSPVATTCSPVLSLPAAPPMVRIGR